jgi:hypothetical protein
MKISRLTHVSGAMGLVAVCVVFNPQKKNWLVNMDTWVDFVSLLAPALSKCGRPNHK